MTKSFGCKSKLTLLSNNTFIIQAYLLKYFYGVRPTRNIIKYADVPRERSDPRAASPVYIP